MQFRKDINGLRAIAVIAVVLFHFNTNWMPGGFAGVDVFFVISGFLMTGIIFRGIEQNNFSILKFYVARANRIIPALAVLCLALLVFGWFYLTPLDYKALGKHVGSSITFLSNIVYWKESGYFEAASHEKWLLHTWSLSVEWQFYMIYPLVLLAMRKFMAINTMKAAILAATVVSFIFCVIVTYKWPNPAYYLLPTRAWEMMIGGVAFLYPFKLPENKKKVFEWLGVSLIVLSYIFISKENPWPGYLSLLPVTGAFLLIQAQRSHSLITGNALFQLLGKWSYSIYLWHWPFVVAIYFYSLNENFIYLGIVLSVFCGFLSNKYIETIRFKKDFIKPIQYLSCKPIYYLGCTFFLGIAISLSNGAAQRFNGESMLKNQNAIAALGDWHYPKPNLRIGNNDIRLIPGTSDKNILFIGASHIEQTYPYVEAFSSEYNVYFVTKGGCFVTPSFANPKWSCSNIQNYKALINEVNFDKIVTSLYSFDSYLSENESLRRKQIKARIAEYDDFLKFAKSHASEVYMILGEPKGAEFDPITSTRHNLSSFITKQRAREDYQLHYAALEQLREKNNVKIIDPINYLCDDICPVMDDNYQYYYRDPTHMRPWYAKKSLRYLEEIIEPKLASLAKSEASIHKKAP